MWFTMVLPVWMVLLGVLTFAYWYIRNQFSFWAKRGVAFKKPHWLFGNFGDSLRAKIPMAKLIVNIYEEFRSERFCGVWQFFSPLLIVIDPELIQHILVKDCDTWSTRGLPFNPDHDPLSATLIHLNGEKWKSVRSKLSPAFTPVKLKQMYDQLLECSQDLEKYLDTITATGGHVEVWQMSARFLTDVNGALALGIKMNALNDDHLLYQRLREHKFVPSLMGKIVSVLQISFPRLFKLLKIPLISKETTDLFLNMVKQNFEYREKNNIQRDDFTDLLRSLKNIGEPPGEDEVEFDDKLLAAQAFDFFLGSFETGSGVISYGFYELAVNEDVQNHLREEVHRTKAADNGEITWDSLNNMKYLDMVVQEILRKHPMTLTIQRMSITPYRISDTDVELPADTMCLIPIYAIHYDPVYYPDPEKFDPERFTQEAKSQRPAFTFLPFGAGPRNCIGLRLGKHQMKVALVKMVDKFKVTLSEKMTIPLQLDPEHVDLVPKGGIWLSVSKISSN